MKTLLKNKPYTNSQEIKNCLEIELIILCADTHIDSEKTERIKTIVEQEIDWKYIIQMASYHKLLPLLYHKLNLTCSELVPNDVLTYLQHHFQSNATRNLFLTNELLKLLNIFESQQILAIPIKGAILASSIYGNFGLRQFCDLDILVRSQDVVKARDLLVAEGYESTYKFTRKQEIARLKSPYCKDNNYIHKHNRVNLDFHWQLLQKYLSFPLEHEKLWQRHGTVSIAGKKVRNLSTEDNLLFLCVHGSRDRWKKLTLVSDVAQLIRVSPEINWEWLMEQAKILGCKRRFLLGMLLAKNLLGTKLPKEIIQSIEAEPGLESIATELSKKLFELAETSPKLLERYLFDIRIREQILDKVNYSLHQSILVVARKNGILPAWI